jgi:predicted ester cyclase
MATTADASAMHRETVQSVSDLIWSGDYGAAAEYMTDDFVGHDPMIPGGFHDAEEMAENFGPMFEALSDVEYVIHDVVADGDYVFHRGELTATHSGEYMGVPATNERFSVQDHIEWRFEDGEIAEAWAQYDVLGMFQALGMDLPGQE